MTRDEAVAKTKAAMHHPGGIVWCSNQAEANAAIAKIERDAQQFVDASAALGMLKLDEPKQSARGKFITEMRALNYSVGSRGMDDALKAFDAASAAS